MCLVQRLSAAGPSAVRDAVLGNIFSQTSEDSDCHRRFPRLALLLAWAQLLSQELHAAPQSMLSPGMRLGVAAIFWVFSAGFLVQHLRDSQR